MPSCCNIFQAHQDRPARILSPRRAYIWITEKWGAQWDPKKRCPMMNVIDDRATKLGEYIVENNATVRCAAKQFGVSKSTVHMEETKQNGCYG
ncbi:sporulation transcriptional regulator SpoIIID [Acutalibacter intestini]|uniref:sporulation transcriptional regulator SpoIIID n=1 Tax=Acutalibacter intestini TaxID=3093659 RepID=UPI00345FC1A4